MSDDHDESDGRPQSDARGPVERTVQLAGNSTFVVSLPKEWATDQGLEAGMSMYLYPHEDRLIAAPDSVSGGDRSVAIDATGLDDEAVVRRTRTAYLAGADRIEIAGIEAVDDRTRRNLERTIGRLIGVEIAAATDETITVANLLDVSDVSLPQTIAQARQLALEMHADAIAAVVDADADLAERVIERDDDVDRLFAFVARGFHRGLEDVHEIDRLGTDRTAAFRDYRIARQLERIADHAEGIATAATRQSESPAAAFGDRLETVGADARTAVERALAGGTERALETSEAVHETVAQLDRRLYDRGDPNAYLYGRVLQHVRRTAAIGVNIAHATSESRIGD